MPDDIRPEIIPAPRQTRPMMIKNLAPRLPERGKVKIGAKGKVMTSSRGNEFQPPVKLDHFRITTLERGPDGNFLRDEEFHRRFGDKPTEIPVRLLYDDPSLNFPTRYACFIGRTLWCSGDGEFATRLSQDAPRSRKDLDELRPAPREVKCPCFRQDPAYQGRDKCKMNGNLSVIIEGASGLGGVWNFRTTSYNSVIGLMSSMSFIRQVTGGPLANIPLKLRIQPKQAAAPTDGSQVLIYVVGLEFSGDIPQLQQIGHQIALDRATTHLSIVEIETEARRMLALAAPVDAPLPGDNADDVVEEFYPEQVEEPTIPPRPRREDFIDEPGDLQNGPDSYALIDADGVEILCGPPEIAAERLRQIIGEMGQRDGERGLAAAWENNARVVSQLREEGHDEFADEVTAFYSEQLAAAQSSDTRPRGPTDKAGASEASDAGSTPAGVASADPPTPQKNTRGAGLDWPGWVKAVIAWSATVEDYRIIEQFRIDHLRSFEQLRLANATAREDLLQGLADCERILRGGNP